MADTGLILPPSVTAVRTSPIEDVRSQHRDPPEGWVARLHARSPVSTQTSWLTFRWLPSAERWAVYECVPADFIPKAKREQLERPWWTLPASEQYGRRVCASAYQVQMWVEHKVWACPMWVLQGNQGGTPAQYTLLEEAILKASGKSTEVPPAGMLPYANYDRRAWDAIGRRDRIVKASRVIERMKRESDTTEIAATEIAEAEKAFRETFFAWWEAEMSPMADFLEWYTRQSESEMTLRKATAQELNAGSRLKEEFIEHGIIPSA